MKVTHLFVDRAMFRVRPSSAALPNGSDVIDVEAAVVGDGSGSTNRSSFTLSTRGSTASLSSTGGRSTASRGGTVISSSNSTGRSNEIVSTWSVEEVSESPANGGGVTLVTSTRSGDAGGISNGRHGSNGKHGSSSNGTSTSSSSSSSNCSCSNSADALSTLGMDQASFVSLSLDGGDEELLESLGLRTGDALGDTFHGLSKRVRDLLVFNIALNSTACVRYDPVTRTMDRSGNRTECALLEFAYRLQVGDW